MHVLFPGQRQQLGGFPGSDKYALFGRAVERIFRAFGHYSVRLIVRDLDHRYFGSVVGSWRQFLAISGMFVISKLDVPSVRGVAAAAAAVLVGLRVAARLAVGDGAVVTA